MRAVEWVDDHLRLLDQTKIPHQIEFIEVLKVDQLVEAIVSLAVRGAPALGAAGAYGVVTALDQGKKENWSEKEIEEQILKIRNARPTAVNLAWGVDQAHKLISQGRDQVLKLAHKISQEDEDGNKKMGKFGADWILKKLNKQKINVLKIGRAHV